MSNEHPNLRLLDHPLVLSMVGALRQPDTDSARFRDLVGRLATLLAYEATRDLPLEEYALRTPIEETTGRRLAEPGPALVPILRSGLGMVAGVHELLPDAPVGHIGLERDESTFEPRAYYFKVPPDTDKRLALLLDPMLATGGSAAMAVDHLAQHGIRNVRLLCLVAAPEGVHHLATHHPHLPVYACALDRALNDRAQIVPGLGDAGDRMFGT